jgi:hypothetical protein
MPLEELRLKLDSDGDGFVENTYDIYPVQLVEINSTKDAFSIAPPGLSAAENILLGVGGMQADITITASVWDDGSDRSNGSNVVTVEEQTNYLEETMHAPDFSAGWQLDHLTGNAFNDDEVFVENIDLTPISLDSPKWKPVTFRLRRGESV